VGAFNRDARNIIVHSILPDQSRDEHERFEAPRKRDPRLIRASALTVKADPLDGRQCPRCGSLNLIEAAFEPPWIQYACGDCLEPAFKLRVDAEASGGGVAVCQPVNPKRPGGESCRRCGSANLRILPAKPPHFRRLVCRHCGKCHKYMKTPKDVRDSHRLRLGFGKHRGEQLGEVARRDPGYVRWLAQKCRDETGRAAALVLEGMP
jgi:hypothetical protein